MQCEKCGSEDVQRLEMIWQAGTRQTETTTYTDTSGTLSPRGVYGKYDVSSSSTHYGTSQTVQGASASPPTQKPLASITFAYFMWGLLGFIPALIIGPLLGVASGASSGGTNDNKFFFLGYMVWYVPWILWCIRAVRVNRSNKKYNKEKWPEEYRIWQGSWMCHRCGCVFYHPM